MKTKRFFTFLCAVCLCLGCFYGCSRKNDSADVHVFYYTYSDTYISTVRAALDKELEAAGISYQDHDGNNNQTTQTEQVQTEIGRAHV